MRRLRFIAGGVLVAAVVVSAVFWSGPASRAASGAGVGRSGDERVATSGAASGPRRASRPPVIAIDYQSLLKSSDDYQQLVADLRTKADRGDAEAEYYSAAALRYCHDNLGRFARTPQGRVRTLDEALAKWARRPDGYRREIADTYRRCRGYLENLAETDAWSSWLDMAVAAGYPRAQSMRAADQRIQHLVAEHSQTPLVHDEHPETAAHARELAIESLRTGDPEPIFAMASWVDGRRRSADEYAVLSSAWHLLACQRGLDCGPSSEWLRSACDYDPQCAPGQTAEDYLRRHLGSQFDEASKLAGEIGWAIDAHSWETVTNYL